MKRLRHALAGLAAVTALAACGGPGLATVSGTVLGSFPCGSATTCQRPIGIQALTFQPEDRNLRPVTTDSDTSGRYSVRLPAGTWTVLVGGGAQKAWPLIHVAGYPGERQTVDLALPIVSGEG